MSGDPLHLEEILTILRQLGLHAVAAVLLFSGTAKLFSYAEFRKGILFIPHARRWMAPVVARGLPIAELAIGIGLVANLVLAKIAALGLFLVFIGVALVTIRHRLKVQCNCFGAFGGFELSYETVALNGGLILLTLQGLGAPRIGEWWLALPAAFALVVLAACALKVLANRAIVRELGRMGAA